MAIDQLAKADQHLIIREKADIPDPSWQPSGEVIIFTGPPVEEDRVSAPPPAAMDLLLTLADSWNCPILVEADGARKLPLKAPADHEPPIPDFVDTVIVVAGLSGLGKPLRGEWVHRPELYSDLVNLPLGEEIHSSHIVKALVSTKGGLKNIPPGAQAILVINQLDSFPNWKVFHDYLDELLIHYQGIAFTVLEDEMLLEYHQRIAGIILAAGGASRFGKPKQLLDWKGTPLVRHVVNIARNAGLSPLFVVSGAAHQEVESAVKDQARVIHNPDWEAGQSTSVRAGVLALPADIGGVVFLLVDQPLIPVELVKLLRFKHAKSSGEIIYPLINERAGNPVLFSNRIFQSLSELSGDQGGKALFDKFNALHVSWEDPQTQLDIDSPADYQKLLGL
jgi:molybdenum cofactor cytidylyltransferase